MRSSSSNVIPLQTQFSAKSPPKKPRNGDVRPREWLTPPEVDQLINAARKGRHSLRDSTLILVMYRHGLRVSEVVSLRWDMINFKAGTIQTQRVKNGVDGVHPLTGRELRALRKLHRETQSPYVFVSERGTPMTTRNAHQIIAKAGKVARFTFPVHPHQLRLSAGYKLINDAVDRRTVQQYLGHASINSTVTYTKLNAARFKDLWRD